jgi:hypothetical protein
MTTQFDVAKPITRQGISEVGKSLSKIYDELRKFGYSNPGK